MGAYTYSTTAASNTSVDSIGSQGSSDAANIDNLIRALAASDAALVRDLGGANTVGGTADAITVAPADPTTATSYFDGMILAFRVATDSTSTAPTLNVDTIGAKTIKRAIQGVESALIAGDLQAGQTAVVIYRSAWATAAGAFELLNPSIDSTIELGHATDTTLSRSAAGQLAIEGGAGSLYAATIELGAASDTTLARSSAGVVTVEGNQIDRVSYPSVISLSGTSASITGIPSWAKDIEIGINSMSFGGADNLIITLGDAGGLETSGYGATLYGAWDASGGTSIASAGGTGMAVTIASASRFLTGIMRFKLIDTNSFVMSFEGSLTDGSNFFFVRSTGNKTLSGTLTTITFTGSASGSFDFGTIKATIRG